MKRILLALALGLLATAANAQCTGNAASTSVCGNASGSSAPAGWTRTPSVQTLTLTPPTATTTRSILSTQTGPTTAVAGPQSYNLFNITHRNEVTGSGTDATGNYNQFVAGHRWNMTLTGSTPGGQVTSPGLFALADLSTSATTVDKIGLVSTAYSTNPTGRGLYGFVPYAAAGAGASLIHMVGIESDVAIATTGAATYRIGVRSNANLELVSGTAKQGTTLDAAYAVSNNSTTAGAFEKVLALQTAGGFPAQPVSDTADWFFADTAQTMANFANLGNITFTGKLFAFPNFVMAANGEAAIGGFTTTPNADQFFFKKPSSGTASLISKTNTTTGYNGFSALASTGPNEIDVLAYEANNTSTRFGVTVGGWTAVATFASPNGLIIGTTPNVPVLFGQNNLERMRLNAGLNVGGTADPGAGILSAATGFRINNAATSGNVLRGNGTNFVSAQLGFADLASGGTAPAFTLGGTVSGGGNQINNVIIGTSTPLAGNFTALSATTSAVFGPNLTPNSGVVQTVNANTVLSNGSITAGTISQTIGADSTNAVKITDSFGTGVQSFGVLRRARGTAASPTAVQTNDGLGFYGMVGATGANTYAGSVGAQGGVYFGAFATENWSPTNQGSKLNLYATQNGAATLTLVASLQAGVQVGAPTGGDPGTGKINVASGYSANGTAGLSVTKTVRASGGAADCTLIYTYGLLTGGTC